MPTVNDPRKAIGNERPLAVAASIVILVSLLTLGIGLAHYAPREHTPHTEFSQFVPA